MNPPIKELIVKDLQTTELIDVNHALLAEPIQKNTKIVRGKKKSADEESDIYESLGGVASENSAQGNVQYASASAQTDSPVQSTATAPAEEDRNDDRAAALLNSSEAVSAASEQGLNPAWYVAGATGVGGGAALAAAGGAAGAAAAATGATAASGFAIGGAIVMGPVVTGHDLIVKAYQADGTELAVGTVNSDGTYTINYTGNYTGVVIVKVFDVNNAVADYMDEATGVAADLTVDLRAVTTISGAGIYTVNLNALTELAAQSMGLTAGTGGTSSNVAGSLSSATVTSINANVASAFGIGAINLITGSVVAVVDAQGANNVGANDYGRALAAISGLEASTGQATASTIASLAQELSGASLSSYGQALVVGGANFVGNTGLSSIGGSSSGGASVFNTQVSGTSSNASAVQAAWHAVLTSADGVDNNATNPTQAQYGLIGITGINTASAVSLLGDVVDVQQSTAVDSVPELQNLATAVNSVMAQASGQGSVTLAQLQLIGITGLNTINISAMLQAITTAGTSGVSTLAALQGLVIPASGAAISGVAFSQDSGQSSTDFITNVQTQTISGNLSTALTSNERIDVSLDNGLTWATASVTGTTFSLSNADISDPANFGADIASTLKIRVYNTGLSSAAGSVYSQAYIFDTTPVDRPDIELATDDVGLTVGTIASLNNLSATPGNLAATDDSMPALNVAFRSGGSAGTIVKVYDGNSPTVLAQYVVTQADFATFGPGGDGSVAVQLPTLSDGLHQFRVETTDLAGNVTQMSLSNGTYDFYVDTSGQTPSAPQITSLSTTNFSAPTLSGTASAGQQVNLTIGGAIFVVTASSNGSWIINTATATPASGTFTPLSAGNNNVSVTLVGPTGSTSTATTQQLNYIAQGVATVAFSNDTGTNTADFITSNAAQTISGTLISNLGATESVEVSLDNGSTWQTATTTTGQNTYSLGGQTLTSSNTLKVRVVDNGTAGTALTQAYVLDTSTPSTPVITSGVLTNSATPTLTGTALTGSTVTVTVGGATYTTTATGGNWSVNLQSATPASGSLSLNANGSNAVSVTATNVAGTTSIAATQSLVIDTTAPNAPAISSVTDNVGSIQTPVNSGGVTDDTDVLVRVSLTGTNAVAGDAVRLYNGSSVIGVAATLSAADITAGYIDIQSGTLTTGTTYALSAKIIDVAGNTSNAATAHNITVDTSTPAAPVITSGVLTNSATPTLTGTALTGSTVTVTVGGATYTTTATGGNWSVNLQTATPASGSLSSVNANGSNAVSVTATNVAGTTSTAATQSLVIDTTAPNAPTITSAALTNNATPIVTGSAEAGATVTVVIAGATYTTTANAQTGAWSINTASATPISGSLSLNANGSNSVSVTATDPAGNTSAAATQSLVIDTTAPNAPVISSVTDNVGSITGAVNSGGVTDDTDVLVRVSLTGTNAVAGDAVRLYNGASAIGVAATLTSADITAGYIDIQSGTLTTGTTYALSAKVTDIAGNTSNAATAHNVTVDTSTPAAPAITSGVLTNSATPTLTGTALSGSTVTVTVGGATYTTTATGGNWSVNLQSATPASGSLSLNANGSNAVSVTTTNVAGTTSSAASQSLLIDTTAPTISMPAATIVPAGSATVTSSEAGTVYLVDSSITPTTVSDITNAAGNLWNSISVAANTATGLTASGLNLGSYHAYAVDAAGNLSLISTNAITVEAGPVSVAFSADTGVSNSDFITQTAAQTITGTLSENIQAGDVVEVSLDNGSTWTQATTTVGQNTYTLSGVTLAGSGTLQVHMTRGSVTSSPLVQAYVLDNAAPNAPAISSVADNVGSIQTPVSNGGFTDDTDVLVRVSLTGTNAVAGDAVRLYDGANAIGVAATLSAANITAGYIDIQSGTLTDGTTYALSAKVTDIAGNTSNAATAHNVTVDTSAPAAPVITSGVLTNSATPTLTGTALSGSTVTVSVGGATYTTYATGGNWSINLQSATPVSGSLSLNANGSNAVSVTATNVAGTTSTAATQSLVIDTTAPNAPAISSVADNVGSIQTPVSSGGVTDDTDVLVRVSLTGTNAVAGDAVRLYDGSSAIGVAATLSAADITAGYIDIQSGTLTTGTTYALSAKITDIAGNTSNAATAHSITVDTSTPAAPVITSGVLTNSATPTLTGTALSGSTVTVSVGGATFVTTANAQTGAWTVLVNNANVQSGSLSLNANGSNAVSVTATNVAGTTSSAATQSLVIDTTAPNAPAISSVTDNVGSIVGTVSSGGVTDDTDVLVRVSLTGTNAVAGDTVRLYNGASAIGVAATLSAANITAGYIDIQSGTLTTGTTYALSAKITDAAGNTSNAATAHNITVDTTAPNAPTITSISDAAGSVTGVVSSGGMTDDTSAVIRVTLSNNTVAGDYLRLYSGGSAFGSAHQVTSSDITNGYVDITPAAGLLVSGNTYAFTAKLEDVVGNASSASSTYTIIVDTSAPTAPVITSASSATTATPTITGTAQAGVTVTVTLGGATYTTTANNQGAWSVDTSTAQITSGSLSLNQSGIANPISVSATNQNGVGSSPATQSLVIDTVAPTVNLTTATIDNTQSATVTSDEDGTVYLVDSSVTVTNLSSITGAAGHLWNSVAVTANSSTSLSAAGLADGTYHAYAVDAVGNLSAISNHAVTIDSPLQVLYYTYQALDSQNQPLIGNYVPEQGNIVITAHLNKQVWVDSSNALFPWALLTLDVGGASDVAYLNLNNGGTYNYSGALNNTLEFTYGIYQGGAQDVNGITILANGISTNSTIFQSGNHSTTITSISSSAVTDITNLRIDTVAPTLSEISSTASAVTLQSNELGSFYLIDSAQSPSNWNFNSFLADPNNSTFWKQVSVGAVNTDTLVSFNGLDDGTYKAYARDAAGNWSQASNTVFALDNNAPIIRSVVIVNPNSPQTYVASASGSNTTLTAQVVFSEPVAVDTTNGTPTLELNIGGVHYTATYSPTLSWNPNTQQMVVLPSRTIDFVYSVAGSENDTNGVSIDAQNLQLNGGVITDLSVTPHVLSSMAISAVADNPSVLVDNLGPQVTSVSLSSAGGQNGYLRAGDVVTATVTFDSITYDTGYQNSGSNYGSGLYLNIGGSQRLANAVSGDGSNQFTFNYTIIAGDLDADGISVDANALSGSITDQTYGYGLQAGQNPAVSAVSTLKVDNTAPTVSSVAITGSTGKLNNYLNAGDTVSFTVTLSEAVAIDTTSVTPRLKITIGGSDVWATYVPGSSTSTTLAFSYTILNGQTDGNGVAIVQDGLDLNGALLSDLAGNTATITHNAVSDNASYMVDTTAPNVPTVTSATYNASAAKIINGSFAGGIGTNTIDVTVNGATYALSSSNFSGNNWLLNLDSATASSGSLATWQDGLYNVSVLATDLAGNTSQDASNDELSFHLTLPNAPSIAGVTDNVGSITGAVSNGGVSDDRNLMLQIDLTGTNAVVGDKIKLYNGNTVLGGYEYALDSQDISAGYVNLNTGWAGAPGTLDSGARYTLLSGNLTDQYYDFNVKLIDAYGNMSNASNTHQVLVDTQPPTATIVNTFVQRLATANTISGYDIQVQSTEQGMVYLLPESLTFTSLSSINSYIANGANANTWKSATVSAANSNITMNLDALHNGGYHLYAVDQAGNISVESTNYVSIYTPGDTTIYLGPTNGYFIAPHQDTTDGEWFYHWDKNGNLIADAGDNTSLTSLNPLLSYDVGMTSASGDIDATHRYGAISQVEVAMGQLGSTGGYSLTYSATAGAYQWDPRAALSTYSDLANIFKPYSTFDSNWGWGVGYPSDWSNNYWTATEAPTTTQGQVAGEHYFMTNVTVLRTASYYAGGSEADARGIAVAVL